MDKSKLTSDLISELLFKPVNGRHGFRRTALRVIVSLLITIFLLYMISFLIKGMEKFKNAFDLILNSTFIKYLEDNLWLVKILIAILVVKLLINTLGIFCVVNTTFNQHHTILEANPYGGDEWIEIEGAIANEFAASRLLKINANHDQANLFQIGVFFSYYAHANHRNRLSIAISIIDYLVGKIILASILSVCLTSLICSLNKSETLMKFNLVPEFIKNSNTLLGLCLALLVIISLFFIFNRIIDTLNAFKKTIVWEDNSLKIRSLYAIEDFNRHAGKFILDTIEEEMNVCWVRFT